MEADCAQFYRKNQEVCSSLYNTRLAQYVSRLDTKLANRQNLIKKVKNRFVLLKPTDYDEFLVIFEQFGNVNWSGKYRTGKLNHNKTPNTRDPDIFM